MKTNNIYLKNKTLVSIKIESNLIQTRTMFNNILKTSNRMINQNLQNTTNTRTYAGFAGKSKFPPDTVKIFEKSELKEIVNSHAQYITDFNIIYENPEDIKLYQIGSLYTKPTQHSHTVSNEKNYKFENNTQQIKFFKHLAPVKYDIHLIKKSKKYFDDPQIRKNIETTDEYKKLFNQVLDELKAKSVKYKIAKTSDEMEATGFNILVKNNVLYEKNNLLETLYLKDHDKV